MKFFKKIVLCIVLGMFLIPNFVKAENKFNLYVFWGDGCPHCEAALEYLDSLDEETKSKFNLVKYEVWKDQKNSTLMDKVAQTMGIEIKGVPFIIIGENHLSGYSESSNSQILEYIDTEYKKDIKTDYVEKASSNKQNTINKSSNVWSIVILIVLVGIVGLIYGIKYITKENKK